MVRLLWVLFNLSLMFHCAVPVVGISNTTLTALPLFLYSVFLPTNSETKLLRLILAFCLAGFLISGFFGDTLSTVHFNVVAWIMSASMVAALLCLKQTRDLAIDTWLWGILIVVAYYLLRRFGFPRMPFVVEQQNGAGILLSTFFAVFYVQGRRRLHSMVYHSILVLWLALLALIASRSSLLAIGLTMALLVYAWHIRHEGKSYYLLFAPLAIFFVIVSLPMVRQFSPQLSVKLDDVETFIAYRRGQSKLEGSFVMRRLLNEKSWELFQRHPWCGVGLFRYHEDHGTKIDDFFRRVWKMKGLFSHNSYLSMLSETGLLGTIPFTVLCAYVLLVVLRYVFTAAHHDAYSLIGSGMGAAFLFEMLFSYNVVSVIAWTMLAVPIGLLIPIHARSGVNYERLRI